MPQALAGAVGARQRATAPVKGLSFEITRRLGNNLLKDANTVRDGFLYGTIE
jgi:hypothetical protein